MLNDINMLEAARKECIYIMFYLVLGHNVQRKSQANTYVDPSQMANITDEIVQFIIKWQMPTEEEEDDDDEQNGKDNWMNNAATTAATYDWTDGII